MNTALFFDPVNFASRIALNQTPGPKEPISMVQLEHNNLMPQKELDWGAGSRGMLESLLHGCAFKPVELK